MSTNELSMKVKDLREPRRMKEELEAEIEAVQDSIKEDMHQKDVDELTGADWKITWKEIKTSRFDSKAFKKENAAMYDRYTVETVTRRFCVA